MKTRSDAVKAKMEEMRNTSFADIISAAKAAVPGFSGFQQSVTVTVIYADLKQVDVAVFWTPQNTETSISLSTYVANI